MSTKHTPGRITFRDDGAANTYHLLTEDGRWWLAFLMNGEQVTERQRENLRRMAACWNACDGISTEALEAGAAADLLEALRSMIETFPAPIRTCAEDVAQQQRAIEAARAAIAKATGGQS